MTLEALQKEMITALKTGNKFRKLTISTLISAVKKAGIDAGVRDNIPEDMVNSVLKKEKKNLVDTVQKFPDMPEAKKNEYIEQALIIDEFIPVEIANENQIADILREIAANLNIELVKVNQGQFMKALKEYNVNMKVASKVFREVTM